MFEVGKTYKTVSGKDVTIIKEAHVGSTYHAVQGDDMSSTTGWRYARMSDCGRCTGSKPGNPNNLVPIPFDTEWIDSSKEELETQWKNWSYRMENSRDIYVEKDDDGLEVLAYGWWLWLAGTPIENIESFFESRYIGGIEELNK